MTSLHPAIAAVPDTSHVAAAEFDTVYEPQEDSWLLCDALQLDVSAIADQLPTLAIEIGPGSGIIAAHLCSILRDRGVHPPHVIGCDLNEAACRATLKTALRAGVSAAVDAVNCDLLSPLVRRSSGRIDVLLFNPPYVPTPSEEVGGPGITAAWAGGVDGREVIDRVLPLLPELLARNGAVYMLLVKENNPEEIGQRCASMGLSPVILLSRKAKNERLCVMKVVRQPMR